MNFIHSVAFRIRLRGCFLTRPRMVYFSRMVRAHWSSSRVAISGWRTGQSPRRIAIAFGGGGRKLFLVHLARAVAFGGRSLVGLARAAFGGRRKLLLVRLVLVRLGQEICNLRYKLQFGRRKAAQALNDIPEQEYPPLCLVSVIVEP